MLRPPVPFGGLTDFNLSYLKFRRVCRQTPSICNTLHRLDPIPTETGGEINTHKFHQLCVQVICRQSSRPTSHHSRCRAYSSTSAQWLLRARSHAPHVHLPCSPHRSISLELPLPTTQPQHCRKRHTNRTLMFL